MERIEEDIGSFDARDVAALVDRIEGPAEVRAGLLGDPETHDPVVPAPDERNGHADLPELIRWDPPHADLPQQLTVGFMEMLGMRPGRPWAYLAGLSEFGGGVLTALGLLNPLGQLGIIGAMSMATRKAHWGKPIWVTEGGAELPVLNIAVSTALMIREPDRYSLDRVLGIRLPAWIGPLGLVGIILIMLYAEQLETDEQ